MTESLSHIKGVPQKEDEHESSTRKATKTDVRFSIISQLSVTKIEDFEVFNLNHG